MTEVAPRRRLPLQLPLPDVRQPAAAEDDAPCHARRGGDVTPTCRARGLDHSFTSATGSTFGHADPYTSYILDESASRTRRAGSGTQRRGAAARGLGGCSLEDFLEGHERPGRSAAERHSDRRGLLQRGAAYRAPRPTQRQAIDDQTVVPADVFDAMMRHGSEVRHRATHYVAFESPSGVPYLKHHDADALRKAREPQPEPQPEVPFVSQAPVVPPRPPSTCASEAMEAMECAAWGSPEPVLVQVL